VIQVQEGIALVLREIRLRTNDETLTAHSARIASYFGNYFGMYVSRILKRNTAQVFT
jgi:hypothetical protein